jgi:hypothetical protein
VRKTSASVSEPAQSSAAQTSVRKTSASVSEPAQSSAAQTSVRRTSASVSEPKSKDDDYSSEIFSSLSGASVQAASAQKNSSSGGGDDGNGKKSRKKIIPIFLLFLALIAGGGFLVNKKLNFFGDGGITDYSQMNVDDALALAKKFIESGNYDEALKILLSIRADGNDEFSSELRGKINALINEAFQKAQAQNREKEIFDFVEKLIADGKSVDALKILDAIKIPGSDEKSVRAKEKIDSLKNDAIKKAVDDGKIDELLSLARNLIFDGDIKNALEILSAIPSDGK